MSRPLVIVVALSVCLHIHNPAVWGAPLGPGFTYQGQFSREGVPANGTVHLRFSLWDTAEGGLPIGQSQLVADIPISGGIFVVMLNAMNEMAVAPFGLGEALWLQIEECADGDCAAPVLFTPRQALTGVPYSHGALSVPWAGLKNVPMGFADGIDNSGESEWVNGGNFITYKGGYVGIGTDSPDTRLQVNDGRIRIRESATLERWDLFYETASEKFYLQENAAFNHLVFTKGPNNRIGVGTNDPVAGSKLHALNSVTGGVAMVAEAPGGNGLVGKSAATGFGATAGAHSGTDGIGVYGEANTGSSAYGVYGKSNQGTAVYGVSTEGYGMHGVSDKKSGVSGVSVFGPGVGGRSNYEPGVKGDSLFGTGVRGDGAEIGVQGVGLTGMYAVGAGPEGTGILASGSKRAAQFHGDVLVVGESKIQGDLVITGGIFYEKSAIRIDHPLDPDNKFLTHTSVASTDMKNIYDGNVVTDAEGYAEVQLPDWCDSVNKDFRYQLTVVDDEDGDGFIQSKIARKVEGNRFAIRTSKPNTEVSWQVTGIRNDPYAKANPFEVETMKKPEEKGKYLSPELYGQPKEKGIHYRPDLTPTSAQAAKSE